MNFFKENYNNIYDGHATNGASVLITNFEFSAKRTLSRTLFIQFSVKFIKELRNYVNTIDTIT